MTPALLSLSSQQGQRFLNGEARLATLLRRFVPGDVALEGVGVVGRLGHRGSFLVEGIRRPGARQFTEAADAH